MLETNSDLQKVTDKSPQVIHLTPEMANDYDLTFLMTDFGFTCHPTTALFADTGVDSGEWIGVWFLDDYDDDSEPHNAKFGDYIVLNGFRDAYVLTAEEFAANGATPVA